MNTQFQLKDAGEVTGVGYFCPLSIKQYKSAKGVNRTEVGVSDLIYLPVSHRHLEPLLFSPDDSSIVRSLRAHLSSLMRFLQEPERGRIHTHPEPPVIDTTDKWAHESDNSESKCWIQLFIPDTVSSCRPDHLETWGISVLLMHPRHFHLHKTTRCNKTKKKCDLAEVVFIYLIPVKALIHLYSLIHLKIFIHTIYIFSLEEICFHRLHKEQHSTQRMYVCVFLAFPYFPWPCERCRNTCIIIR